jgi:hypothetical protein
MEIINIFRKYLGWCPNVPAIRTAPAVLVVLPENIHPAEPGSGRSAGSSGRIRHGVSIATGSLKAMFRDRQLLWFSALAGLVMLFLIAVEEWSVTHIETALLFSPPIPFGDFLLIYPDLIIDTRLFLVETGSLSYFIILLAALILYRTGRTYSPLTIRGTFAGVSANSGPLAALSVAMALAGTLLYEILSQSLFFGKIIMTVSIAIFYLPYAYYLSDPLSAAIFFSVIIMFVNIFLFLVAFYIIPVIMREKKGLVSALLGSFSLMRKTRRELLGCAIVFGVIILAVAAVALVIGQSPFLLNRDFDIFINLRRGQTLMTVVCYGFIAACWALMAAGFTAAGIAIGDLSSCGTDVQAYRELVTGSASGEPAL